MNSIVNGAVALDFAGPAQRPTASRIARIHLLGPMRATSYLGDDILPRGKEARALFACLCLAFGAKVPRTRLTSLLWDTATDQQARSMLRQALNELCSAMGPFAGELISAGRSTIRVNADACWIDVAALLEQSSPASVRGSLASFCTGKLLEDLDDVSTSFDRWLWQERARFSAKTKRLAEPMSASRPRDATFAHQPSSGRNRLRVAVLPFEGKGAERGEDLAVSLSHDIAAALARFRWFDVITPISLVSRAPRNFTSGDFLERDDLDYAVDGAVNRHGRVIEVNVRLLNLTRDTHPLWSERFELRASELHRLNEVVTARLVGSIDPVSLFIEGQPNRRPIYGATGLLLLAIPLLHSMERDKFERAGVLIHQAMRIDPQDATAPAWAALWHFARLGQGWAQDNAWTIATMETLSRKAIQIDPDNAEALGIYAHTCAWKRDFDSAIVHFDRSLRLNPNSALMWAFSAPSFCYIGEPVAALQRLKRYRDLAPFHPYACFLDGFYAIAYMFKGDYEQAVLVGRATVKGNPDCQVIYRPLIAALGHLGRTDEAKPYVAKLLSLQPHFTVEHFGKMYPFKLDADRQRYMQGLKLAGVPER
jgi:TolB-like protein/cytochrome c-type biogenesis protein CcmH/NrfG